MLLIESPFITLKRVNKLLPVITKLRRRGVRVIVNSRHPDKHDTEYSHQACISIHELQSLGVKVLYTVKHHRKLAVIDGKLIWEGSLNILSQNDSCEIMRRTESGVLAEQMLCFIGIREWL